MVDEIKRALPQEIIDFARKKYPDISDALIKENVLSFYAAMETEEKCKMCFGLEMCSELNNTSGFATALELDSKTGQIVTVKVPCQFCRTTFKPKRYIKYRLEV